MPTFEALVALIGVTGKVFGAEAICIAKS